MRDMAPSIGPPTAPPKSSSRASTTPGCPPPGGSHRAAGEVEAPMVEEGAGAAPAGAHQGDSDSIEGPSQGLRPCAHPQPVRGHGCPAGGGAATGTLWVLPRPSSHPRATTARPPRPTQPPPAPPRLGVMPSTPRWGTQLPRPPQEGTPEARCPLGGDPVPPQRGTGGVWVPPAPPPPMGHPRVQVPPEHPKGGAQACGPVPPGGDMAPSAPQGGPGGHHPPRDVTRQPEVTRPCPGDPP